VLFSKIRELEDRTAEIVRALALVIAKRETSECEPPRRNVVFQGATIPGEPPSGEIRSDRYTSEAAGIKSTSQESREFCDHENS
jgi:hypothetical protein